MQHKKLKQELALQKEELSQTVDTATMELIEAQHNIATNNEKQKVKERQKRKFDSLAGKGGHKEPCREERTPKKEWVLNLSLKRLTNAEMSVLEK